MKRLLEGKVDLKTISPVTLAFVGDGVYDLMVREMLVCEANRPSGELHKIKVGIVRAEAQSQALEKIMPHLTEEEIAVFKRGRNAKTTRGGSDYHRSTGFECLFGYHYLDENLARIRELFKIIFSEN